MLGHLTEAQQSAFLIADNRLTENSSWDDRLLGEQLKTLAEMDLTFDLEATGFEVPEIDLLIDGLGIVADTDADDQVPAVTGPRVTRAGDLWQLGKHRVHCGDALRAENHAQLMAGAKANLVITDPPYNVVIDGHASGLGRVKHREFGMASGEMSRPEFTDFLRSAMVAARESSLVGSLAYWFMDWRHMDEILGAGTAAYSDLLNLCVWTKTNAGMGSFYRSAHELIFLFKNGTSSHRNNIQLGKFGRYRTNVWSYPGANVFSRSGAEGDLLSLHPTPKPVALIADVIKDCTARADIVLDPFLGSGTAVIAAERTGRVCYGLELDPCYVDGAIRRWQAHTGLDAVLVESGETFKAKEACVSQDTAVTSPTLSDNQSHQQEASLERGRHQQLCGRIRKTTKGKSV
jgi:DNA modification methylase